MLTIKQDNVLNDLKTYPDNHFHTIYCDPPYNLSTEWTIGENGNPVVKNKPKDFMGKWEGLDENSLEELFNQFFRVTKHGSYVVMYGLDRQLFAFNYYAMKAGFEITQSLHWFFISSFPKATDLSKQLDKRLGCDREVVGDDPHAKRRNKINSPLNSEFFNDNSMIGECPITAPSSDLAKQFDGMKYSKTPFKQCTEQIMVFRKPPKVSILDDIINNDPECSPSCVNIDGGRVPTDDTITNHSRSSESSKSKGIYGDSKEQETYQTEGQKLGRYPATVFIDSGMAEILDKQSGIKTSAKSKVVHGEYTDSFKFGGGLSTPDNQYSDSGGCSRVLHHCDYEDGEYDLLNYFPKVSGKERNAGLEHFSETEVELGHNRFDKCKTCGGTILQNPDRPSACKCENPVRENNKMMKNHHPTLKPISLNKQITSLFKLPIPNQKLYIPFAGTFSETIGAKLAGFDDITVCEMNPDYIEIGTARYNHWTSHLNPIDTEDDPTDSFVNLFF